MKRILILVCISMLFLLSSSAQGWIEKAGQRVKNRVVEKVENRIDQKVDNTTDKVLDSVEKPSKKQKKNNDNAEEGTADDVGNTDENAEIKSESPKKLESVTAYDFVPGDKILFFEDFSQDAIGDFPALWTTNGGGEVKTVNKAPGKWLHMNGEDAVYCYSKEINFPENFIVEFDLIPDDEYGYGICLTLYQENSEDPKEVNSDLYPGLRGLHITSLKDGWETKGYDTDKDWLTGQGSKAPVVTGEPNHVIVWIQKRRVRIYHQGQKVLDVPTNIYAETKFNKLLFSGWDRHSAPFVTNIKITTASPDTRSKLITEGKLVTYGITFDVNKADIKPESYGTLKSIADVLTENPGVKVKITGHTDSDGDDAKNLELSKRRAESVKNELNAKFGIDASRLTTEGAGETKPVAPNDTPENKAKNRRVEFLKL
ncbi:MAG: Outer rane porin [Bacteroidetes bacterium]|nr:Outer rane porin [Bacteroidota bacterium]